MRMNGGVLELVSALTRNLISQRHVGGFLLTYHTDPLPECLSSLY